MNAPIKDAEKRHWVYRAPKAWRPFFQLSRLDRPIGYWLLALPGWIALSFAAYSHGFAYSDLYWAFLIFIGAIAMRGAGCTYNDIVDQDLDKSVDRTALRPLPAGQVTTRTAWVWLFIQCGIGLLVLLQLPRLAQIIALCSIPLVAAYPFMKRITWWPQAWLGIVFNWAALVAYAAKTGQINPEAVILYAALIFWTIGYDTIYACQDIEDDAVIGVKSTARLFGDKVKGGVFLSYLICIALLVFSRLMQTVSYDKFLGGDKPDWTALSFSDIPVLIIPFALHLFRQSAKVSLTDGPLCLRLFKSNRNAAFILIILWLISAWYWNYAAQI